MTKQRNVQIGNTRGNEMLVLFLVVCQFCISAQLDTPGTTEAVPCRVLPSKKTALLRTRDGRSVVSNDVVAELVGDPRQGANWRIFTPQL